MLLEIVATTALLAQVPGTPTSKNAAITVPRNALARDGARLWHFDFTVSLRDLQVPNNDRPFEMPLIVTGPWSQIAKSTLCVESADGNTAVATRRGDQSLRGSGLQGENMVSIPVVTQTQRPCRVQVSAECVSFSAVLDETEAQQATWPAQWPSDLAPALQPQPLIESNDPVFTETIQSLFGTNLKMVSPYLAAKRIIQYCCDNVVVVGTPLLEYSSRLRGLNLQGALQTAREGRGFESDLSCVCVAMLRAAGIPARPVVGITMIRPDAEDLKTWAEFYLPGSGWVPFSPKELQRAGVRSWKIDRPWRYLGTWSDLDEHLPLAWSFAPGDGSKAYDAWAIFGWTRLAPQGEFPLPESVSIRDPRTSGSRIPLTAQLNVNVLSGGPINERDYQQWIEGQRRPLRRRKDSR